MRHFGVNLGEWVTLLHSFSGAATEDEGFLVDQVGALSTSPTNAHNLTVHTPAQEWFT